MESQFSSVEKPQGLAQENSSAPARNDITGDEIAVSENIYLRQLNPAQQAAAACVEGPVVIYAGAGSGKTRTIVHRIAHMINSPQHRIPASAIMAVTFTNKAAKEMRERVEQIVGASARSLVVSTFHSACARFLRVFAHEAGYKENFSIFDDDDQKALLKDIVKQLNVSEKLLNIPVIKSRIDRLKNAGESPEEFAKRLQHERQGSAGGETSYARQRFAQFGEQELEDVVLKVYELYQQRLKQQNAMDFNDLLVEMVKLLETNERVRGQLQARFRYFLVDEFQDTNPIQFRLIAALCSHTHNLCIVGDDDQSIYSWRGAEPAFILDFDKHYPEARVFKLEQNYRSSDCIVSCATRLISYNTKRAPKTLWTAESEGEKVKIKTSADAYDESRFIVSEVLHGLEKGIRVSDFAVLYRTNAQSRAIEDELRRRMIPYIIYGSVRFYERAEIKVLLAYLRLLINPDDDAAFQKIINTPRRGFGDKALLRLKDIAQEHQYSLARAADRIANSELPHDLGRGVSALKSISQIFSSCYQELQFSNQPSAVLGNLIVEIKFEEYVRATYPEEAEERWLNVLELKNGLVDFEERFARGEIENPSGSPSILALFLEQALLSVEPTVKNVRAGESEAVTLMTVHSSKGLEFERVFITGLEEGTLPHQNSLESEAAIEEERRLLYVAITRARKELHLCHIKRHRYRPDFPSEPSRFLYELPAERIEHLGMSASTKSNAKPKPMLSWTRPADSDVHLQKHESPLATSPYYKGQKVQHRLFGTGVVQAWEKSLEGWKVEVKFPLIGVKKLMHNYLTILTPND